MHQLLHRQLEEVLVRPIQVVVRVGVLQSAQVAVAEQQLAGPLGSDVLQRDQVREHRQLGHLDPRPGGDRQDLLPVHADGQVDPACASNPTDHGPAATTTDRVTISSPEVNRTPHTPAESMRTSTTEQPCRTRAPALRAAAANACAVR